MEMIIKNLQDIGNVIWSTVLPINMLTILILGTVNMCTSNISEPDRLEQLQKEKQIELLELQIKQLEKGKKNETR